jgi:hypothetical protein
MTVVDNHGGRTSLTAAPMAEPAMVEIEKQELVAAGNARRPVMTSATTAAVTATGPGTADSPGVGERPTWPKLRRMGSSHCS